jgi:hypothetical protein
MANTVSNLEALSTRTGFNAAVRYIQKTIGILEALGPDRNLGDILYDWADEELSGPRRALILRMLLLDKLGYRAVSVNLAPVVADPPSLAEEFSRWKAVDLVAVYHHPDAGPLAANPKNREALGRLGPLGKRELLVIYAGYVGAPAGALADALCEKAALLAIALFQGDKPDIPAGLYRGKGVSTGLTKKRTPGAASSGAAEPVRMTPRYSVAVTNELFHNGNVEAWKRIIESYHAKYPGLRVYIYYEGERILDINTLFKWGKVKHGSSIQFAIAGSGITDVAKLRRYLAQGASRGFEVFLRGSIHHVLALF